MADVVGFQAVDNLKIDRYLLWFSKSFFFFLLVTVCGKVGYNQHKKHFWHLNAIICDFKCRHLVSTIVKMKGPNKSIWNEMKWNWLLGLIS